MSTPGVAAAPAHHSGEPRRYRMYIDGDWVDAQSGETFETVDPYTGDTWAVVPRAGPDDVDRAVNAARRAFDDGPWGRMTAVERARLRRRLADVIAERATEVGPQQIIRSRDGRAGHGNNRIAQARKRRSKPRRIKRLVNRIAGAAVRQPKIQKRRGRERGASARKPDARCR